MRKVKQRAGMRTRGRGQSTAEYAIVFGVVLAALVAMQVYVKRGVNARLKDVSDSAVTTMWNKLGKGAPVANDLQYEPYYTASDYTVTQATARKESVLTGGIVETSDIVETTGRTGSQTTKAAP